MAHTHAGNAGDFLKHTILAEAAVELAGRFGAVRYIDPYCGQSLFRRPTVFQPHAGHPKLARLGLPACETATGAPARCRRTRHRLPPGSHRSHLPGTTIVPPWE